MIKTEAEYQRSLKLLMVNHKGLKEQEKRLHKEGLSTEELNRLLGPTKAFLAPIEVEVKWYEDAKK